MSDVATNTIHLKCECGATLKVPATAVGRRAKCPKCGAVLTVTAPPVEADSAAGDDLFGELAKQERSVAAATPTDAPPRVVGGMATPCPECGSAMAAGAVLCTACGYNTRTGKSARLASTGPGAAAVAAGVAKSVGSFALGCVLSLVGGLLGATVWFFVAMGTGYELGFVAWGVGLAAGAGMAIGARMAGPLPGVIASGIALLSIVVAKFCIFIAVIVSVVTGNTSNSDLQRAFVTHHLAEEILVSEKKNPDAAKEADWVRAEDQAEARIRKMSDAEFKRELERLRAKGAAIPDETADASATASANDDEAPQADAEPSAGVLWGAFFGSMFGFMDLFFIVLAVVTAFRFGSGGFAASTS